MSFKLTEVFQPKLFELFKKGNYNKQTFTADLIAGVIVGIIALPLAIALVLHPEFLHSKVLLQP